MEIQIVNLESLSYEQLSDLDRTLSKKQKEIREEIRSIEATKPLNQSDKSLTVKSQFLTKVRTIVNERINVLADNVNLQEVL